MSIERKEIINILQGEKERYDQLIENSKNEEEIKMLQSLLNHILFKLKILEIKNHAS
ncbi:hypothetical protein [Brevibacillus sp. SYSU BS000544]|uniref:hypothetical protein n=1 Tax=Brevibacillus sp. SYSU BS000544 TaxID=3416443 RepID=UPI003CE4CAB5